MQGDKIEPGDVVEVLRNHVYARRPGAQPTEYLKPGDKVEVKRVDESSVAYEIEPGKSKLLHFLKIEDVKLIEKKEEGPFVVFPENSVILFRDRESAEESAESRAKANHGQKFVVFKAEKTCVVDAEPRWGKA